MRLAALAPALLALMPALAWAPATRAETPAEVQQITGNLQTTFQTGADNRARVEQNAVGSGLVGNTSLIIQGGAGNSADVRQTGTGNTASVSQHGSNNTAGVDQNGSGLSAKIEQHGNNQGAQLNQWGAGAGQATVRQY